MYATIDIETTGLNRYRDSITYIGIGLSYGVEDEGFFEKYILNMSLEENIEKLREILNRLKIEKFRTVLQNGKFDTLFIEWHYGIVVPVSEDIMLMGTVFDLAADHDLKGMAFRYLGIPNWDIPKKDKCGRTKESSKLIPPYLKKDVNATWGLFRFFMDNMDDKQMLQYKKLLMPAAKLYRDAERLGIYFDRKQYRVIKKQYEKLEEEKLRVLTDLYDINWNSPQQKSQLLYKQEKLPVLKKTKSGAASCDAGTLKRLAALGYDLPTKMTEYTAVNTANKMFLKRWGEDSSYDGRIHPSFNLTNVVSGRTSCTDPNLQQVPRAKDLRSLFHASRGMKFFEADYSQLELRIAAHYAQEPTMLRIYREKGDIHTETAKLMTGGREPTKDERGKAKAVNFGFLYGMGAKKFVDYAFDSYGVVFTLQEATKFRQLFFAKYSRLLEWHKECRQMCEALGGVYNMFGRFRKLPGIYSDNWSERGSAERISINTPVQGTGSDLLLSSAIQIKKELEPYGLNIVGTVHDSILGEFPEEYEEFFVGEIKRIMIHPALMDVFGVKLKVALDCDVGVGKWGVH